MIVFIVLIFACHVPSSRHSPPLSRPSCRTSGPCAAPGGESASRPAAGPPGAGPFAPGPFAPGAPHPGSRGGPGVLRARANTDGGPDPAWGTAVHARLTHEYPGQPFHPCGSGADRRAGRFLLHAGGRGGTEVHAGQPRSHTGEEVGRGIRERGGRERLCPTPGQGLRPCSPSLGGRLGLPSVRGEALRERAVRRPAVRLLGVKRTPRQEQSKGQKPSRKDERAEVSGETTEHGRQQSGR